MLTTMLAHEIALQLRLLAENVQRALRLGPESRRKRFT
jgi:hypothetical protein